MVCSWAALGTLKCWATCLNTHLCHTCSLALELIEKVSDVAAFFCSLPVTHKMLPCIKQENIVFVKLPKVKQIICIIVSKSTAVELPPEHWLVKLTHQSAYVLCEYPCYVVTELQMQLSNWTCLIRPLGGWVNELLDGSLKV